MKKTYKLNLLIWFFFLVRSGYYDGGFIFSKLRFHPLFGALFFDLTFFFFFILKSWKFSHIYRKFLQMGFLSKHAEAHWPVWSALFLFLQTTFTVNDVHSNIVREVEHKKLHLLVFLFELYEAWYSLLCFKINVTATDNGFERFILVCIAFIDLLWFFTVLISNF